MSGNYIVNNFVNVVTKKYFCFEGRAGRKEFWCYVLAAFVIGFVLGLIPKAGQTLSGILNLALLLPGLGIAARRLHDIGKSGWLLLLALIPLIGPIILLIFYIKPGDAADNAYGPAPQNVE